ncbi:hypothetical protein BT_2472 [Bartonella tribocorum CIP 105476]|uniref:Uncharacterized protein n=1 Tax=Bartonella tribocorum (strain DSM 28219 / CCUG 45778 / CIP 105476 / IBS 506) TaxID=382640 RepID=A9IYX8_BART1|nr:hypothetical protein BT_2472 [Bartonella tribocorum CIP 105476]
MSPYGRLASLIVSAQQRQAAEHYARALRQAALWGKKISRLRDRQRRLSY